MIIIPRTKNSVTKPKTTNKKKEDDWEFELGEEVIYYGILLPDEYTNQIAKIIGRKKAKDKITQHYEIEFKDGETLPYVTAIKKTIRENEVIDSE